MNTDGIDIELFEEEGKVETQSDFLKGDKGDKRRKRPTRA